MLALLLLVANDYAVSQKQAEGLWLHAAVDTGVVGGDVVLGAEAGVGVETAPFAVHLAVPIALRVVDLRPLVDPAQPAACKVVRCEEWLEAGTVSADSLGKIVEDVRAFQPGDWFYLKGGGLFATLGHGALVDEYTNAADWDRRRSGLYAQSDLPWGRTEIQALTGDFLAPQRLFGARLSTSPMAPATDTEAADSALDRFLGRMRLGFEAAGDATAPTGSATDAAGDIVPGSRSRAVGGVGVDVTWPLLDGGALQLAPWVELSGTSARALGTGASAGLDASFDVAFVALRAGASVLLDSSGHRFGMFDTLYDVDRRIYALASGGFSTSGIADLDVKGGVGGAFDVELVIMRIARVGGRAHLDPQPDTSRVELYGELDAGAVRLDVRAQQRALGGATTFGDRTFIVADAAWQVFPPFSLFARYTHGPRFRGGVPKADDDVVAGASFDLVLTPQ